MTGKLSYLKNTMQKALDKGVSEGVFCGAQAGVYTLDGISFCLCSGKLSFDEDHEVNLDTRFDLASLTKLYTAWCVLRLFAHKTIRREESLQKQGFELPQGSSWRNFTFEQLLAHETFLPAWKPLFENVPKEKSGTVSAYEMIMKAVYKEVPVGPFEGGFRYSDLGFIGIGDLLRQRMGIELDELMKREIFEPKGFDKTGFIRSGSKISKNIASTQDCPWRGRVLKGEVDDENAFCMGGVAGHAGLFSTVSQVLSFGIMLLQAYNGKDDPALIPQELAREAFTRRKSGRGLGVDLKSGPYSLAGTLASEKTFGHLGFTGTSLWVDPIAGSVIVLLSNRIHKSRENAKIKAYRPYFHDEFYLKSACR